MRVRIIRMGRGATLVLALAQFVPADCAVAQRSAQQRDSSQRARSDTLPITVGTRVRLQVGAAPTWMTGVLEKQDSARVFLSACSTCKLDAIDERQVGAVQVSQGRTSSHIVAGAVIGALVGTAVGVVLVENKIHSTHPCDNCGLAILAVPEFTGGGLFIGTVTGALMRREKWAPLTPPGR